RLVRWLTTYTRRGASPSAIISAELMEYETDVRDVLAAIHVPTLILHRVEDEPAANRYMAEHIAGAEYVACPARTTCLTWAIKTASWTRSSASSRAFERRKRPWTGSSPPCSSPTSSVPPRRLLNSATAPGKTSSRNITRPFAPPPP